MADYDDLFQRLEELNAIGVALSRERNLDRLLEKILAAAKGITNADAGTIYLMTEDQRLKFAIMRNDTLDMALGGTTGHEAPFYPVHLMGRDGAPNNSMVVAYAALHDETVNIADAYEADGFDFTGTRNFDRKTGYRSRSFLTVPMKNHVNEIIGVLQLINAKDRGTGEVTSFFDADQRLAESLASQAAIALTNASLISQLEALFESFITVINAAIDEKSPYTGGHCQRVPELTMMLAEAVNRRPQGSLADFRMSDADRYELKIAGLLHDCGKVTTPVHVVDKATKLQTLFDRIHLVDQRFEVLKRDAEIAMLRERLAAGDDPARLAEIEGAFAGRIRELDQDRAFLRRCNIGGEAMSPADQQRVRDIGTANRWRTPEGVEADFLTEDEIRNLAIARGTLTPEEREVINRHIEVTIRMLESLPWPGHLRRVPEFAGGHHERMDGRGYPRGLTRTEMSVQARIMGIADIFEALTAVDRPYKQGKKLSEALGILGRFKLDGHVDPDLFDIFVREKVYLEYARRFLEPEQIDEVDETLIPGYQG